MPVVTLELVDDHPLEDSAEAMRLQALSNTLGKLFNSSAGGTWLKLHYLPRAHYAENEVTLSDDVQPTFVTILKRSTDSAATRSAEAQAVAAAVADALQRPAANVHVFYEPPGAGRVAFGGKLVQDAR